MTARSIATCLLVALFAAPRAVTSQTPVRFSVATAVALPIGDLGDGANVGFALGLRGEGRLSSPSLGLRGDLGYDHFGGRGPVASYSYVSLAGNLTHRGRASRVYEFGGVGLYNSRSTFTNRFNDSHTDLGLQGGVGVDFRASDLSTFMEFGLTSVFTSGRNSLWFPVRFGLRF